MNYSLWPFLWFGLPGRLLTELAMAREGRVFGHGSSASRLPYQDWWPTCHRSWLSQSSEMRRGFLGKE